MRQLKQTAVLYDLQKLEFQSTGNEIDGRFRMTRIWQGDTETSGLQTHEQLLKTCGRGELTLMCGKSELHKYQLMATGYGLTISGTNKRYSHPQLLQFAEVLKIINRTYLVVGEV